jgi:hypothetical protein
VQRVLPELRLAEATEFVSALASLAGALWQIANPMPALAELYASDPGLAQACVDLTPRLHRTAEILLAGLIPSRMWSELQLRPNWSFGIRALIAAAIERGTRARMLTMNGS